MRSVTGELSKLLQRLINSSVVAKSILDNCLPVYSSGPNPRLVPSRGCAAQLPQASPCTVHLERHISWRGASCLPERLLCYVRLECDRYYGPVHTALADR